MKTPKRFKPAEAMAALMRLKTRIFAYYSTDQYGWAWHVSVGPNAGTRDSGKGRFVHVSVYRNGTVEYDHGFAGTCGGWAMEAKSPRQLVASCKKWLEGEGKEAPHG